MVQCRGMTSMQHLVYDTIKDPLMPTYTLPLTSARFRLMVVDLDSIVSAAGILNPADATVLRAALSLIHISEPTRPY